MLQTTRVRLLRAIPSAISQRSVLLQCSGVRSASSDASPAAAEAIDAAAARAARRAARMQPRAIEGTVPYYERHFVIVDAHGRAEDWPKKLEFSDHIISSYAQVTQRTAADCMEITRDMSLHAIESKRGGDAKSSPLNVTAAIPYKSATCSDQAQDAQIATEPKDLADSHDVLVFPENIRIHDVSKSNIEALVEEGVHNAESLPQALENLNLRYSPIEQGFHMLACAHANRYELSASAKLQLTIAKADPYFFSCRDFRCACAGPKMLQWLDEIATDAKVPLHLWAASHYGGHRYAGNCVVYPTGDWFGMLNSKEDVQQMVEALTDNQPLRLQEHWRGRIRLSKEQQIEALKQFGEEAA
ncbi:Thioredoxin-like fold, partial [Globisporangium splendens]